MSAPNELSFLPEDYLEQKYNRRANIVCGLLFAMVLGVVGAGYRWMNTRNAKIEASFAEVDGKFLDAARKIEQVKRMHEQQREVVHHAELAASLVEKVPRSNILAELTNALPPGVSLLDMSMHSYARQGGAAPQSSYAQHKAAIDQQNVDVLNIKPPQFDVKIAITGIAENDVQVAQLISRLNHAKMFQDVNLVVSDTFLQQRTDPKANKDQLRKWQIELTLNPAAEVRDAGKIAAVELGK